jgi:5-methylcytosine-specific restriction endonuclease McrA
MTQVRDEWVMMASRRRKVSAVILAKDERGHPPSCWLCGQPGANSVDHVLSRSKYPELVWDESNMRPAHTDCNSSKGATATTRDLGSASYGW